jgi:hypothetical protein
MPSGVDTMSRLSLHLSMDLHPFVQKIQSHQCAQVVPLRLWDSEQVGELYVHLLCRFEAREALPFLQSHDNYRVEVVLPFTQKVWAPLYPSQPQCAGVLCKKGPGWNKVYI